MASSIAAMTILRSMDFSRATASAICNSSSRFALIPACAMRIHPPMQPSSVGGIRGCRLLATILAFALLGAPQRLANELVCQNQARLADQPDRQAQHLPPQTLELDLDAHLVAFHALQDAAEPPAARNHLLELDLGLVARPVLEVGRAHQRPVDAGRG